MSGECTQPVCKLDIASGGQISVWLDFMHLYEGEYVENTPGGREEVVEASNPTPAIGAFDAPHDGALSWTPGATAVTQKVYLGTSLGDVNTADANSVLLVSPAQDANSYDASLDFDTTYFWRIDGIDSAGEIVKGTVWSFTTRNYVGIDDMESYSYQDDSRIFNAWRDGYDNATENGALGKLYVDDIRLLRQVVEIPAAADQPVIDGQLDASWDAVQAHPIDAIRSGLPMDSNLDCSGTVQLLWDAENLYVLTDINDEALVQDSTSGRLDDRIEIFIDADGSKTTGGAGFQGTDGVNDYQYCFSWNPSAVVPVEWYFNSEPRDTMAGVDSAVVLTDTGYRVEVKLPWSTLLGAVPSSGDFIGIALAVADDDDGGSGDSQATALMGGVGSPHRPNLWGTARLSE